MRYCPQRVLGVGLPRADLYKVGEKGLVIEVPCGFIVVSSRSAVVVSEVFAKMLVKDVSDCCRILLCVLVTS